MKVAETGPVAAVAPISWVCTPTNSQAGDPRTHDGQQQLKDGHRARAATSIRETGKVCTRTTRGRRGSVDHMIPHIRYVPLSSWTNAWAANQHRARDRSAIRGPVGR